MNFTFPSGFRPKLRKCFVCTDCSVTSLTLPNPGDTVELRDQRSHPMPSADIGGRLINLAGPWPCPSLRDWHMLSLMASGRVETGACVIPEPLQSI